MKVVITGATSGLGLAFAIRFLELGDQVVISSRTPQKVTDIVSTLQAKFGFQNVFGVPCDVTKADDVKNLAQESVKLLSEIDLWINNAGTNYKHGLLLIDNSDEMLQQIVETNLLGSLYGCREALKIMTAQNKKKGHIINIAGRGTDGNASPKLVAYASTKRALDVLHKSLLKETKETNVGIHLVSPSMVMTKLLIQDNTELKTKKVFNILAEHPTVVANQLVPKMRALTKTGTKIVLLDKKRAAIRFMTAFRFKNKFFDSQGNLLVSIDQLEALQS